MSTPAEQLPNPDEAQSAIDKANGNPSAEEVSEGNPDEAMWSDFDQELDAEEFDEPPVLTESEVSEEEVIPEEPVAPEPEPEPVPATPPAEEPNAVPEPAPVVEPPPAEVATPQPETQPQEVQVPPTPPEQQYTPEQIQQYQRETRARAVEEMAANYSLNDEEATAFLTDPGSVVPKFRAELFFDVFDATAKAMLQAMPKLIQSVQLNQQEQANQENAFYKANPLLKKDLHQETVNRFANAYIHAVPGATPDQVIKDVGVQVMYALGINPEQPNMTQEVVDETPPAPPPYVPPGAGQATSPNIPDPHKGNPWSQIAEDLDEDD